MCPVRIAHAFLHLPLPCGLCHVVRDFVYHQPALPNSPFEPFLWLQVAFDKYLADPLRLSFSASVFQCFTDDPPEVLVFVFEPFFNVSFAFSNCLQHCAVRHVQNVIFRFAMQILGDSQCFEALQTNSRFPKLRGPFRSPLLT